MRISEIGVGYPLGARLFQSGWINNPAQVVAMIPQPMGVVSLATDDAHSDLSIPHNFLLKRWIPDNSDGIFYDGELLAITSFVITQMKLGVNVLVHCIAGQSRSSYVNAAILAESLSISGEAAIAIVRRDRGPIDEMQSCFIEHLKRKWPNP